MKLILLLSQSWLWMLTGAVTIVVIRTVVPIVLREVVPVVVSVVLDVT